VNYFELYPGDYLRDTTRLSMLEHGAYLRMLIAYFGEEQPLPADNDELFNVCGAKSSADKAAAIKIAERFFPIGDDGLRHNKRADEEIEKARRRIATAQQNGSKGGRKPKPKENPPDNPLGSNPDSPNGTNPPTHSGEALHAPHATFTNNVVASVEVTGGAIQTARANSEDIGLQARIALCNELAELGITGATAMNASLVTLMVTHGVSADEVLATAREGLKRGIERFNWVTSTLFGRLADAQRQAHQAALGERIARATPSKTLGAIQKLEEIKREMAENGSTDWPAKAALSAA